MENVNSFETMAEDKKRQKKIKQIKNKRMKKIKYRLIIGGVLASTIIGGFAMKNEKEKEQIQTIVNYYGEGSEEDKIVDYIQISESLNSMKLSNYSYDEDLFTKFNISNELKSPEEINDLINDSKNSNLFISSKDLKKQSSNVELKLNLIMQEKLVNDYIYTTGYSKAYSDIKKATQKYSGEVFGIEDTNNINIGYDIYGTTGESNANLYFDTDKGTKKYVADVTLGDIFNGNLNTGEEGNIIDGAKAMNNVDSADDVNEYDNDEYNKIRNKYIKEALEQSVILNTKVEEEDLYNENLAKKIR